MGSIVSRRVASLQQPPLMEVSALIQRSELNRRVTKLLWAISAKKRADSASLDEVRSERLPVRGE
jgi:hypothetical protein